GLDEGVVVGDLGEFAAAQQVGARVADVGQGEPGAGPQHGRQGGAHVVVRGGGVVEHRVPRVGGRVAELAQQVAVRGGAVERLDGFDRGGAGGSFCTFGAEAVGDR